MEPTMGRIVFYTPGDPNDTSAVQAPAIVSRVAKPEGDNPPNLDLTVFPPGLPPYSVSNVPQAESGASEPATWCWPPAAPVGSAPEAGGSGSTDTPTSAEGEGSSTGDGSGGEAPAEGGASAGGDQGGEQPQNGEPATTSEASEKPLYLVSEGVTVPDSFSASGLETPDGQTLYHCSNDTAGQPHTFDIGSVEGVGLYAESDDNSQPVKPAEPAAA